MTFVLPQFDGLIINALIIFGNSVLCVVLTFFPKFSLIFFTTISLADK